MSAVERPDAPAKLDGRTEYGTDLERPGMLWAVLVLAPLPRGRLRAVDLSGARSEPGAIAIAAADVPRLAGPGSRDAERPLFAADEVVYPSQPVAAVAAPTLAAARRAAARVRLDLEPLPAVSDLDSLFPEWPAPGAARSAHVAAHVHAVRGDVEAAFRSASTVVEETYRTASVHQVALEPHACVAETDGTTWTVRTSTQSPFGVREDVASLLGVPESSVRVEGTWVGGGFGGKGASLVEPYALLLARAAGRPVRLALTYREEFQLGRTTLPAVIRLATAVTDGRIVARRVRLLLDVGTSLPGRDFATGYSIGFLLGPYRTPAFEVEGYAVRTNKPPFGPHRAPFAPQCAFAVESHLEEVARRLGVDPGRFKADHLVRDGDTTPMGQTVTGFGLAEALDRARATARRWRDDAPEGHGVGLAVGFWSTGTGAGGEARLRLTSSGLTIEEGEREIGSGSVAVGLVVVAAERTGLPRDRIAVTYLDTSRAPYDTGVFGSRTVGALGRAVDEAAVSLLRTLQERWGRSGPVRLGVDQDHVVALSDGERTPVETLLRPEERTAGGLVAEGKHYGRSGTIDESVVRDGQFYPYTDFAGAAHVAEVRVDRATGAVVLVRYAAFQDVGRAVDRASVIAQVEGGVVMGLGTALTEEAIWREDGRLANPGLLDYRIPTLTEVPPIEVTLIEGHPGAGPGGAKGVGEPPIIPVPAAVAAAVRDASGAHVTELPLTGERVARTLSLV